MTDPGRPRRRRRRSPSIVPAASAAAVMLSTAGATAAVVRRLMIAAVAPPGRPAFELRIIAVDRASGTVTLPRTAETCRPGHYVLRLRGGAALRVAGIAALGSDRVVRHTASPIPAHLETGDAAHWSGYPDDTPADLGLAYEEIEIAGDCGPLPAWRIPPPEAGGAAARPAPWAVIVHGRGAGLGEGLRAVPVLRDHGFGCLVIAYRNDPGAASSPDGRCRLGESEWRDVDAALERVARERPIRLVVMGWSMGGALALQAARRSPRRAAIDALVLDSPVVDWIDTFDHQAAERGVPRPVARIAETLLRTRAGARLAGLERPLDLRRLDTVRHAAELETPTLILHSDADRVVPSGPSRRLAALRPDLVRLVSFDDAMHTRIANAHPERWRAAIGEWLSRPDRQASRPGAP